ncbi:hypothetical protein O9G_002401 [Rozella allomycis CSF55]|uniref:Uncharacterized protein n=1 Tax=Rozella allomycis (strain CSF55) TaxID=988480 RepID=A0A075AU22_ROZAC|nr:hypothetical protein O9G_002401 [Rozella allomycis CSF55]|eukprot:EPZ33763.1 hypothetical protein O9G_002401 [Rozella allomycis CSF55]
MAEPNNFGFTSAELEELDWHMQVPTMSDAFEEEYFDPEAWYFDEDGNVVYAPEEALGQIKEWMEHRNSKQTWGGCSVEFVAAVG